MNKRIKTITLLIVSITLMLMLAGCADDNVVPPEISEPPTTVAEQSENDTIPNPVEEETPDIGDSGEPNDNAYDAEEPATPPSDEYLPSGPFYFEFNGFQINMFQNMAEVLDALGEPLGYFVRPSCAFEGDDRIYAFAGVEIFTFPIDGENLVHTISLRDDSVRTPEGIFIGMDFDRVLEAYGDDYSHDTGMFTFTRSLTTLEFRVADGIVLGITYGVLLPEAGV